MSLTPNVLDMIKDAQLMLCDAIQLYYSNHFEKAAETSQKAITKAWNVLGQYSVHPIMIDFYQKNLEFHLAVERLKESKLIHIPSSNQEEQKQPETDLESKLPHQFQSQNGDSAKKRARREELRWEEIHSRLINITLTEEYFPLYLILKKVEVGLFYSDHYSIHELCNETLNLLEKQLPTTLASMVNFVTKGIAELINNSSKKELASPVEVEELKITQQEAQKMIKLIILRFAFPIEDMFSPNL